MRHLVNVLTSLQNIGILHGENVGGSSLSIPYFVITIYFNQIPKKLFTVIILLSMSASLFVFFFLFIEKQI